MKFFRISVLLASALFACQGVDAVINNPMTQAVIRVYDQQLQANPNDYETRYRRANEYYRHSEYIRALDDLNQILATAPTSDGTMRFDAYMMRAGIYNMTKKFDLALADLNSAIAIDGNSAAAYYQRANTEYELGDYAAARTDYTRLQRFNSRSPEALVGLARIAVQERNYGQATNLLEQAVSFSPNEPEVYVRRAGVRRLMEDHNGAVEDLLIAISLNSRNPRAVSALIDYGNTNYTAVIDGLSHAIDIAPNNGLYRYLRATIAQAHFNYLSAIDDFNTIIDQKLYNYHGLYGSLAKCQLGLGRYDEALASIDTATGTAQNVAEYFVTRSKILRALNRHDDAIAAAAHALVIDRESVPGLVEMALNFVDKGDYEQAASHLGEAAMIDANDPSVYLLRAWLLEKYLNQPVAARNFYQQACDVEGFDDDNVKSLRGFALLALGRTDEADAWMEHILSTVPDNDGLINYYGACYYAQRDDSDKALACVEKSLKAGYSDNHNWMDNNDGTINVAALRDDLRFLNLMQKYNYIFGK